MLGLPPPRCDPLPAIVLAAGGFPPDRVSWPPHVERLRSPAENCPVVHQLPRPTKPSQASNWHFLEVDRDSRRPLQIGSVDKGGRSNLHTPKCDFHPVAPPGHTPRWPHCHLACSAIDR